MSTTNYFSIGGRPVFFDDFEERSVVRAYQEALELRVALGVEHPDTRQKTLPPISIFRPPVCDGAWSNLPTIIDGSTPRFAPRAAA